MPAAERQNVMLRKLFNIAAALSLVLCVATAALWARSYDNADRLDGRLWGKQSFLIASKQGQMLIVGFRWRGADNWWTWDVRTHAANDIMSFPPGDARQHVNRLGFGIIRRPTYFVMNPVQQTPQGPVDVFGAATATLNGAGIVVPLWLPLMLSAAVPVGFVTARVRRACRSRLGHCPTCGYDVRVSPERCPECGALSAALPATATYPAHAPDRGDG